MISLAIDLFFAQNFWFVISHKVGTCQIAISDLPRQALREREANGLLQIGQKCPQIPVPHQQNLVAVNSGCGSLHQRVAIAL